jgi:predicted dehydrogenase
MNQPFRIGVLGLTHDHVWGVLSPLKDGGPAALVAAADAHAELRKKFETEYGRPVYDGPDQLLAAEELDGVLVYSDNRTSVELALAAVSRGLHVLIEKPLAADLEGAERLLAAVESAGVRLMVNWPFAWWPQMQHALHLAGSGEIGDVWQVKYRAAHAGPKELGCSEFFCEWLYDPHLNGGGAYMDYCCYGAALARTLLGMPEHVTAVVGRLVRDDMQAEDNGVLLMSWPHATAVSEGSWTQAGNLSSYIATIYGTRGTLLVEPRSGGRLLLATSDHPMGEPVEVPPPSDEWAAPVAHFVHCVRTEEEIMPLCSSAVGRDVQEILQGGYQA